jgi:hypothetical protein
MPYSLVATPDPNTASVNLLYTEVANYAIDPLAKQYHNTPGAVGYRNTRWFGTGGAGTYTLITGTTGPTGTGITTAVRKTWTTAATAGNGTGFANTYGESTGVSTQGFPVSPGTTYTASAYVRANVTGKTGSMELYWRDAAGAILTSLNGTQVPLTANTWHRISVTATAPANADTVSVVTDVEAATWAVGNYIESTGLLLEKSDTLHAFHTDAPADPNGFFMLRADANGAAGAVRMQEGQTVSNGTLLVRDYEAALTGHIEYSALSYGYNPATDQYEGMPLTTVTTALNVETDVLTLAQLPQYRAEPDLITDFTAQRGTGTTIHQIINRPDPIAVLNSSTTRSGQIVYWCAERATADNLLALYQETEVLLLRFGGSGAKDLYHIPTGSTISLNREDYTWTVTVDYQEVQAPVGPLLGAFGWTYEDVAASTYLTIRQSYASYADLFVGET